MNRFRRGQHNTPEHNRKISEAKKGMVFTLEHRKKLSGRRFSPEHRLKLSLAAKADPSRKGELNHNWKGGKVGYRGLHLWIVRKLGKPLLCSNCNKTSENIREFHWANISKKYRRDISDWKRLCAKCHSAFDRRNN